MKRKKMENKEKAKEVYVCDMEGQITFDIILFSSFFVSKSQKHNAHFFYQDCRREFSLRFQICKLSTFKSQKQRSSVRIIPYHKMQKIKKKKYQRERESLQIWASGVAGDQWANESSTNQQTLFLQKQIDIMVWEFSQLHSQAQRKSSYI